ncbi:hypothetical protein B0A48_11956 [Cryoendolithus antarcticus]|uniref:Histone chaperone RTT106/FACT complex subunit SPT16-like middle domain-containing protein n=1 Tax=Cryoendolithus antarcticus TaxID=1507870 RepID=A0A1V8STP2_9PEZI|nr:hypothetical protein B0A48_11956 [Cryoendolithus antarcticus]
MARQPTHTIAEAFAGSSALSTRVLAAYRDKTVGYNDVELLRDIAEHILTLRGEESSSEPPLKKRKLPLVAAAQDRSIFAPNGSHDLQAKVYFECKDVSFTSPARKKLRLQFVRDHSNMLLGQIRLMHPTEDKVEYAIRREDVDQFFYLPVPDKAQRQRQFVIIPLPGSVSHDGTPVEPVVWTMNEVKGRPDVCTEHTNLHEKLDNTDNDTIASLTLGELDSFMTEVPSKAAVQPDDNEFASAIPQSHRKGEKAYHVKVYKGYLFFLPVGILFGFKKPIQFFSFASIDSTAFQSVLQRTFNLVITARESSVDGEEGEAKANEFSMIDQADFAGIEAYIKRHELSDASMAKERRAKVHNVNKPKGENGEAHEEQNGESELAKAEAELQDAEDEEEEDYNPSGGESEGEGEESGDEEGGAADGGEEEEEMYDEEEEEE